MLLYLCQIKEKDKKTLLCTILGREGKMVAGDGTSDSRW